MTRRPVRWRRLLTYVVIAYGGAWLICLPLWLGQGLRTPHAKAWIVAMMFTPALAGLVTVLVWPDGRRIVDVLGLRPAAFRRWWWTLLVGWLGPPLLVTIAVGLAIAAGQFPIDWGTWSMFRTTLPNAPLPMPLSTLLLLTVASSVLANVWLAGAFAAGEEIGWRGFLRDELSVLPRWALILVTGSIWGLWHAPDHPARLQLPAPAAGGRAGVHGGVHDTGGGAAGMAADGRHLDLADGSRARCDQHRGRAARCYWSH